jgi:hypothetical protein
MIRRTLIPLLTLAATLIAAGAASAAVRAGAAAVPAPQQTVTAVLIRTTPQTPRSGTIVSASNLGERVFLNSGFGVALAAGQQSQSAAVTTDGGHTWRITSPALHVDAAQAPLVVSSVGVASRQTFYAYGGGQVVDTTSDGGKQWYRAVLGDLVLAVVPGAQGQLIALTQVSDIGSSNASVTEPYVSHDGGRIWRYDTNLDGS